MIAAIGVFIFWAIVAAAGVTAAVCAVVGFMFLLSYRR